jgi:hypothetical protein
MLIAKILKKISEEDLVDPEVCYKTLEDLYGDYGDYDDDDVDNDDEEEGGDDDDKKIDDDDGFNYNDVDYDDYEDNKNKADISNTAQSASSTDAK